MRHDTQQHEEDGHGHYDDIVTNTATQKKHLIRHDTNQTEIVISLDKRMED